MSLAHSQILFVCVLYFRVSKGEAMDENKFKTNLIKRIKEMLPGAIVVHLDPNEIQGIPDILVLYQDKWAALEGKKTERAIHQPNQDYYVDLMNRMSFARFIFPENVDEVLYELYEAFQS